MTREQKQQAVSILHEHYEKQLKDVFMIDERLCEYFRNLIGHSDKHNAYEILCAIKFLRLLRTYEFNTKKVKQVLRLREGEWKDEHGVWKHVKGGIACPGTGGAKVYRWEPFQVFVLASVFGFHTWVDTQLTTDDRQTLLSTEKIVEEFPGEVKKIYDLRRLCTDYTFYAPRKTDKTGLSAFLQVVFFLLEDSNAEAYCCANSSDQAKLLYRRTKMMLQQLDDGHRWRMTETVCDWRPQFKMVRDSSIRPLSAGGKTKDGMFAQLCCADEYGSAPYTNGKSDMKMLVDVIQSSMGPRREPLTFTTTTAGRIQAGPFVDKLETLHRLLMRELRYEDGDEQPDVAYDRIMCICFEPDDWEKDDVEKLTSHEVVQKVNPMLGKIVQHQFYADAVAKARLDGDMGEIISKLFNVYQSNSVAEWIKPERIRELQVKKRIEDCKAQDGWVVFTGLDFSQGDDLHTAGYLAVRSNGRGGTEFFADFDAWIKEDAYQKSSVRDLYDSWVKKGHLHISPGQVFQPSLFIKRLQQLIDGGVQFLMFGYDSYRSGDPINTLKAFLVEQGVPNPDAYVVPVSQTYASYNAAVDELSYDIKSEHPGILFSDNPMWPWVFGNCILSEDLKMENKKPVKRNPGSDSCKVDPVQTLCTGLILFDRYEWSRKL